jgi:hypothetical protein
MKADRGARTVNLARTFLAVVVVAAVGVLACGGSSSSNGPSGGSNGFPYTGPSCPPGTQATLTQQTGACGQCVESQCNQPCVVTDCSPYYTCVCGCAKSDTSCQQGCTGKLTASCASCFASVEACFFQACGSVCVGVPLDAGPG